MKDKLKMFDGIVCICTKHEEDRWQKQCVPQFEKLGCMNKVIRVDVEPPNDKPHYKNCEYAHYTAIKICKEKKFKMPLILESDFHFVTKNTDFVIERLPKSLDLLARSVYSLRTVDWKLFFLGGKVKNFLGQVDDSLIKVSTEHTHAYSVNPNYYDEVIDTIERNLWIYLDWVYSRRKYANLYNYSYMTSRIIVEQRGSEKEDWRSSLARKNFTNLVYNHLK
tara:strand:+ start:52940 stop:53605 length:666 start_codon:yes stop_codon:yes gene_type:complete